MFVLSPVCLGCSRLLLKPRSKHNRQLTLARFHAEAKTIPNNDENAGIRRHKPSLNVANWKRKDQCYSNNQKWKQQHHSYDERGCQEYAGEDKWGYKDSVHGKAIKTCREGVLGWYDQG